MKLTPKTIEHLKPRDHRVEIPDAGAAGLYLVLQSSGVRSWAVRYRHNGRSVKLTLAKWPAMTLADARKAAADAQHALAQGNNPAKAKQTAKIKAMETASNTVANVCADYLRREGGKLRTLSQRTSLLRRLVYPHIGERPITEIKRSEIVAMLDKIEDHNGPRMADVTLAVLRKVMNWHAARSDDFVPPFVRGMARQNAKDHRRERTLDDDELRRIWAATADGQPFSALVRFALLTSARRGEIAGMKRDEIDDGVWRLPASRSKTKVEITRPLSAPALAVLDGLPRINDCAFSFTNNGRSPIGQFSLPKAKLDAASGVTGWRLHDLRRTARSLLSRAGVHSDIAEKCLGHSRGDIIERYDQHKYLDEMQRAFEMLAAEIERIVNPPEGGAVIPMRRRR
jgi:integrase